MSSLGGCRYDCDVCNKRSDRGRVCERMGMRGVVQGVQGGLMQRGDSSNFV